MKGKKRRWKSVESRKALLTTPENGGHTRWSLEKKLNFTQFQANANREVGNLTTKIRGT